MESESKGNQINKINSVIIILYLVLENKITIKGKRK